MFWKRILIAVDDLTFGQAISNFVIHHKWDEDVEFLVLHVMEPVAASEAPSSILDETVDENTRKAQALVEGIAAKIDLALEQKHVVTCMAEYGIPKQQILDVARDWNADAIVMGSHGRHGLNKFLMGSVSMAVMTHAHCSVVVIRLSGEHFRAEPGQTKQ